MNGEATVLLNAEGFQTLKNKAMADPEFAARVARDLDRDPLGAIERLFRLTPGQKQALSNATDLDARVAEVVQRLNSGAIRTGKFVLGSGEAAAAAPGDPSPEFKCECRIEW